MNVPNMQPKVLVVDDDSTTRLLMRQAMESAHYQVIEAADGQQAVNQFIQHRPSIVLMDVNMPNVDGFSACRQIRKIPGAEKLPIVMVTGLDDYDSIKKAYDIGATDFITKPINWLILTYRVQYILRAHQAMHDLGATEKRLAHAQEMAHIGNWDWEITRDTLVFSKEVCRIVGINNDDNKLSFTEFLKLIHPEDRELVIVKVTEARAHKQHFDLEFRILHDEDDERIIRCEGNINGEDNTATHASGIIQDLTEKRKAEEEIRYLAYYDQLTQLPNQFLFKERLGKAIIDADRSHTHVAVLLLNLDNFKSINDAFDHATGDQLLQVVADRVVRSLRETDIKSRTQDISSRFGGDEFGIVLEELCDLPSAAVIASRIIQSIAEEIKLKDQPFYLASRIGISIFPQDGTEPELLLRNAAAALSRARETGKNSFQFYTNDLNARAYERFLLESSLRKAIDKDQLRLYYQPKVDINTGFVVAVEALIRWMHPEHGLVSPVDFIPLAEDTGLIIPIGEWVLETACAQIADWKQRDFEPIQMAVNLSAGQFRDKDLINMLDRHIKTDSIKKGLLELEVTESMLMDEIEIAISILENLRARGARIAIDDFGTGYSSLSYLKRFPLSTLKIDRSFVHDITNDEDDAAIVNAIISMSSSLNITVVAEGVETEEQLLHLKRLGCDIAQGFLISPPVPAHEVEQFFGDWNLYTFLDKKHG